VLREVKKTFNPEVLIASTRFSIFRRYGSRTLSRSEISWWQLTPTWRSARSHSADGRCSEMILEKTVVDRSYGARPTQSVFRSM